MHMYARMCPVWRITWLLVCMPVIDSVSGRIAELGDNTLSEESAIEQVEDTSRIYSSN